MLNFNVSPILFISFLLVTRQCLGASLKQSSSSYSSSQVLKALDMYQSILEQRILIAFRKYQTKYFAKRQPYANLQLVRLAQKNYSKDELNDTAKGALFRICKLLSVFQSSVYLAWYDEGHGGSVAKTLRNLSHAINDTLQTAMYLANKLNYRPLPSGEFQVSRESMDNRVIQYKKIFKDSASVNSIRSWRTLYEMKYHFINELVIQVKKLHNSLKM